MTMMGELSFAYLMYHGENPPESREVEFEPQHTAGGSRCFAG